LEPVLGMKIRTLILAKDAKNGGLGLPG
jgi:hypothetical protein